MSGIVGIFNLDEQPVNKQLLQDLTNSMAFRGPDAQDTWHDQSVGFGHTLLRTNDEAYYEQQPYSLDGLIWIVADARIDGRAELVAKLGDAKLKERFKLGQVPDVELILHTYLFWNEECVQHLLGDFAFVIWDSRQKKLFCVRDHFGVKLFYYALVASSLIFSNTLNCVRQHPLVSSTLNERTVGDFLLFDINYSAATTIFADIQSLPPAHTLSVTTANPGLRKHCYWKLPAYKSVMRFKSDLDYLEHFKELMDTAVADRMRSEKIAIFFSGGLDSTTIAASAQEMAAKANNDNKDLAIKGFTTIYDHLMPDQERYYAELTALALGIPVQYQRADEYPIYQDWGETSLHTPQPLHNPLAAISADLIKEAALYSRVGLHGQGGDEALKPAKVLDMVGKIPPLRLLGDLAKSLFTYNLQPQFGIRSKWRDLIGIKKQNKFEFEHTWLNKDFVKRLGLTERWDEIVNSKPVKLHSFRSTTYEYLQLPIWVSIFEAYDPGVSRQLLEVRFPFLDLRLLEYLLSVPPLPWLIDKQLLRSAMQGTLPDIVRLRPKSLVAEDQVLAHLLYRSYEWEKIHLTTELSQYVEPQAIYNFISNLKSDHNQIWQKLNPISLNFWLERNSRVSFSSVAPPIA